MRVLRPEFRHTSFFVTIVVWLLLASVMGTGASAGRFILALFVTGVLIVAAYAVSGTRRTLCIAVSLAVPAIVVHWLAMLTGTSSRTLLCIDHLLIIAFFCFICCMLLRAIVRSGTVSLDSVMGAASVYLLIGLLWALAFSLVEVTNPGSLVVDPSHVAQLGGLEHDTALNPRHLTYGQEGFGLTVYYSYVTLTTLGYGDIHPIDPIARTLAVLEAVVGQLYLTILIAGLVGVHISGRLAAPGSSTTSEQRGQR